MKNSNQSNLNGDRSIERALITGATGFIGGYLVRVLADAGWEVHALSRNPQGQLGEEPRITWHRYDCSYQSAYLAIQQAKPSVVFHLASLFLPEHQSDQIDALGDANLRLGMHLLEAMRKCGVTKLVNTGTNWQHLNDEEYNPVNLYAATKQALEAIIDYYCKAHSLCAITLKLFDTYGPGDQRKKLIPMILEAIEASLALNMTEGLQQISPVHVLDVCEAYKGATLLLDEPGKHSKYGVFADRSLSIRQIVAALEVKQKKTLVANWGARASQPRQMQMPPQVPRLPNWKPNLEFPDF